MRLGGIVRDQNYVIVVVMAQLVCPGLVSRRWKCCADGAFDHRASCHIQHPYPAVSITHPNLVAVSDEHSVGARAVVGPASRAHCGGYRTDETRLKLIYHGVGAGIDDIDRFV